MLMVSNVQAQQTINFYDTPLYWMNSPLNFHNTTLAWANSQLNFANSPLNVNNTNAIYAPDGRRIGYTVPKPSGGINLFVDGNRVGYTAPASPALVPLTPMFRR